MNGAGGGIVSEKEKCKTKIIFNIESHYNHKPLFAFYRLSTSS